MLLSLSIQGSSNNIPTNWLYKICFNSFNDGELVFPYGKLIRMTLSPLWGGRDFPGKVTAFPKAGFLHIHTELLYRLLPSRHCSMIHLLGVSQTFPLGLKSCPTTSSHLSPGVFMSSLPEEITTTRQRPLSFLSSNSLIAHLCLSLVLEEEVSLFLSQDKPSSRSGVYGKSECVSAFPTHFNVGVSSFIRCTGVAQIVCGFLSEGTVPRVAVESVYA